MTTSQEGMRKSATCLLAIEAAYTPLYISLLIYPHYCKCYTFALDVSILSMCQTAYWVGLE